MQVIRNMLRPADSRSPSDLTLDEKRAIIKGFIADYGELYIDIGMLLDIGEEETEDLLEEWHLTGVYDESRLSDKAKLLFNKSTDNAEDGDDIEDGDDTGGSDNNGKVLMYEEINLCVVVDLYKEGEIDQYPIPCRWCRDQLTPCKRCLDTDEGEGEGEGEGEDNDDHHGIFTMVEMYMSDEIPDVIIDIIEFIRKYDNLVNISPPCIDSLYKSLKDVIKYDHIYHDIRPIYLYLNCVYASHDCVYNSHIDDETSKLFYHEMANDLYNIIQILNHRCKDEGISMPHLRHILNVISEKEVIMRLDSGFEDAYKHDDLYALLTEYYSK